MRARILYTNGTKTVDLFWLSHDGRDVYCGQPGYDSKRSYHASGKVHTKGQGEYRDEGWHAPLKDLKTQFHLTTIGLRNDSKWFEVVAPKFEYSGKRSDAILTIDSRSLPRRQAVNVSIGLLEPGRMDVLRAMAIPSVEAKAFTPMSTQQVLLSTSVVPWVYAILFFIEESKNT